MEASVRSEYDKITCIILQTVCCCPLSDTFQHLKSHHECVTILKWESLPRSDLLFDWESIHQSQRRGREHGVHF